MTQSNSTFDPTVITFIEDLDRDVEHGENIIFLGLAIAMMLPIFAPIAPPHILLPLIAITFALSASFARINYHKMQHKLTQHTQYYKYHGFSVLLPIQKIFQQYPMPELAESFNPLKNINRTWKSALGGLLINPYWFPIFYVMGMHILEDKNLGLLNHAVIDVEKRLEKYRRVN